MIRKAKDGFRVLHAFGFSWIRYSSWDVVIWTANHISVFLVERDGPF
jgi:hypothetical protein